MCPICLTGEDAALLEGLRAGALVLLTVAAVVVLPIARFGLQLWRRDAQHRDG